MFAFGSHDLIRKTGKTLYLHLNSACAPTSATLFAADIRGIIQRKKGEGPETELVAQLPARELTIACFPTARAAANVQAKIMTRISLSPWRWGKRIAIAFGATLAISAAMTGASVGGQATMLPAGAPHEFEDARLAPPSPFGSSPSLPESEIRPAFTPRIKVPEIKAPELNCDVPPGK